MTRRTNSRIAGFTFLAYIVFGLASLSLFGIATEGSGVAARIASVPQHLTELRLATAFSLMCTLAALVLGATLYGLTRDTDPDIAAFGLVCRAGEGIGGMPITALGMMWLGTATGANAPSEASAHTLTAFLLQLGQWSAMSSALLFAAGSLAFAWLLLRGRMIPVWLGRLGVASSVVLVLALPLQMLGLVGGAVAFAVMWMPMLVFEVVLAFRLITKGA